ncbi:transcription termination factor NusA [Candidatus Darwinibacter acetoxidans]|jgi:N utilization substance protein A|nr:transcription termination factor NusA [Bacillota bacterium]HBG08664.1 transcription termination/antitermination protein NusA [Bacillota bacterium]
MNLELIGALTELEKERGISKELLLDAIETAIVSAYKKNYGASSSSSVRVEFNQHTGDIRVYSRRVVVDEVEDETVEISLEEARELDVNYELGDVVEREVTPADFGRIAAQTAKQVVIQKIREAERSIVYDIYSNREGDVVLGTVQRADQRQALVDLGDVEAVLPASEMIPGEVYRPHMKLRFYINEVRQTSKGPQIFLSRTHPGLLRALFELEVPEIQSGEVEIKSVAREAGNRSKVAVYSRDPDVDPVGACVGARGNRVQAVVAELGNERIDIVQWERDLSEFVKNALSPAKVLYVVTDEDEKVAHTVVPDDQLSLAIGKEGQNARLAARLTGWRIDIKSETQADELGLYEQFIREPELPEEGLELEEAELELEPDLMDAEEVEVEVIVEAEPEEAEEMPEPAVKEEPKAPAVQPLSEQDLASLTNITKRKSWQERFGAIEAAPTPATPQEKQETAKPKKKKEKVITDLSQLISIDFDFEKEK